MTHRQSARIGGLLFAGLLAVLFVYQPNAAFAGTPATTGTSSGLTLSPTSVNREIKPGDSFSDKMMILNAGDTEVDFTVYATSYSVTGEDYNPEFTPIPGAQDITDWFSFNTTAGHLEVGANQTINYTVSMPADTKPGSYYAAVFAETGGSQIGSSGVVTRKRVGTVFYLRASGEAVEEGKLDVWTVPWLQEAPLTATIKMANTGTVHYVADVKLTVSDIFGSSKFTLKRAPVIIPQRLRAISIPWKDGSRFGLFKIGGTVKYLGKTETLPTKYVLVASKMMRAFMLSTLLFFIIVMVILGKKSAASKK